MAIALFLVVAVAFVALPPLLATIFFDHVRSDPEASPASLRPIPIRRRPIAAVAGRRLGRIGRRF